MTPAATSRASEFRDHLSRRVLVADGAMGTMLYSRGVFINPMGTKLYLSLAHDEGICNTFCERFNDALGEMR